MGLTLRYNFNYFFDVDNLTVMTSTIPFWLVSFRFISFRSVLTCFVPFHFISFRFIMFCNVMFHFVLLRSCLFVFVWQFIRTYFTLFMEMLSSTILTSTAQFSTAQQLIIAWHSKVQYSKILECDILWFSIALNSTSAWFSSTVSFD